MKHGFASLVENISTQNFDSESWVNKINDIFAMLDKCLDQISLAGEFYLICTVAMSEPSF